MSQSISARSAPGRPVQPGAVTGRAPKAMAMSISLSLSTAILRPAPQAGESAWAIFQRITLPLGANGVVVATILNFINIWGEYLIARTLTLEKARTRTVGIALVQPTTT